MNSGRSAIKEPTSGRPGRTHFALEVPAKLGGGPSWSEAIQDLQVDRDLAGLGEGAEVAAHPGPAGDAEGILRAQHTRIHLERRPAEEKGRREAMRCLKRYAAREVYLLIRDDMITRPQQPDPSATLVAAA